YVKSLEEHGIQQSMSRKGNSMDNGLMENFFGILKCEMFYGQESRYKDIDELMAAIDEYIRYYNTERIKVKLKGRTPSQFRSSSL
ncbi:MAG: IS3 family transposase, partial [Clostridia bacterium]|nr:IS3 family transposase [Clostridia bacterium]